MFFFISQIDCFFSKSATIALGGKKNTCFFFGTAQPKSNAHAHLKQRKKNIVALGLLPVGPTELDIK